MNQREIVITPSEKSAAILRMKAELCEWRGRNPDAPAGRAIGDGLKCCAKCAGTGTVAS